MNNSEVENYALLLRRRRQAEILLQHQREDLKARELFLTPTGDEYKALGSNDSDRKTVITKRCAADAAYVEICGKIRALEIELSGANAEIDDYEARRRNDEWIVTRMLAEALHERFVGHNPAPIASVTASVDLAREEAALELQEDPIPF